jgi:hypothetical protein
LRLAPPLVFSKAQADSVLAVFDDALQEVARGPVVVQSKTDGTAS